MLDNAYYICRPAPASERAAKKVHPTQSTLHPIPYTLHPTPYTRHPTPYTLHPTPNTLHPAPYHPQPDVKYLPLFSPQLISPAMYTLSVYIAGEIDLLENLDVIHITLLVVTLILFRNSRRPHSNGSFGMFSS